jgi:hypothetical protein
MRTRLCRWDTPSVVQLSLSLSIINQTEREFNEAWLVASATNGIFTPPPERRR